MKPISALLALLALGLGASAQCLDAADFSDGIYVFNDVKIQFAPKDYWNFHNARPDDPTNTSSAFVDSEDLMIEDEDLMIEADEDDFTKHHRGHWCRDDEQIVMKDYFQARKLFNAACRMIDVPRRGQKEVSFWTSCSSPYQGTVLSKVGDEIIYHCNVSCQKQKCGAGHMRAFQKWADGVCGPLKAGLFYSDWDFSMGRGKWGDEVCGQTRYCQQKPKPLYIDRR
ncbi:hypothetical protein F5Y15DRAFT_373007 [Xylariaceae sp. FL0016]|nr:hypothetical protein F5Y15DRAFT_373007 [Xylariaceae sp. FL0016]